MWYLVLSRRVAPQEKVGEHSADHLSWMKGQHESGRVLFSGPTPDRSIGIYVIHADSLEQAQEIASTDPFHSSGLREPEIIEWEIHQVLGAGTFSRGGTSEPTQE